MNFKQRFDSWFHGWIPKEPIMPTLQTTKTSKSLFTKKGFVWLTLAAVAVMFAVGAIYFVLSFSPNWVQDVGLSVADSKATVGSFVTALDDYNASAAWDLMSPSLQASYGSPERFNETVISNLATNGWHAQIVETTKVQGDFTSPNSLVKSQAQITVELQVTQDSAISSKSYTFDLVKPSEWKINNLPING